jgi:hypothetical protein
MLFFLVTLIADVGWFPPPERSTSEVATMDDAFSSTMGDLPEGRMLEPANVNPYFCIK